VTAGARDMTLKLLAERDGGATICPSEVARAIASKENWREAMPTVHSAIDELLAEGIIRLSWKNNNLRNRAGPYRIAFNADS